MSSLRLTRLTAAAPASRPARLITRGEQMLLARQLAILHQRVGLVGLQIGLLEQRVACDRLISGLSS